MHVYVLCLAYANQTSLTFDQPPTGLLEVDVGRDTQPGLVVGDPGDAETTRDIESVAIGDVAIGNLKNERRGTVDDIQVNHVQGHVS